MDKEKLIKNGFDMIYLSACALHSRIPSAEVIKGMDLTEVYRLSARHFMQAITYMSVESFISENAWFKEDVSKELLNEWKLIKAKVIRNNVLFDEERRKLTMFLEEKNIWYMFLKGIVIQDYYSKLGMRQMCDNDILFDSSRRKEIYDYMLSSGFTAEIFNKGYPDAYRKPPAFLFEMHHSLYTESSDEKAFNDYYADVKNRLIKDKDNKCGYHFSDEDYYIHCTTHAYKHFVNGGSGIRSLMDVYVYLQNMGNSLDYEYIEKELDKLGIKEFESVMKNLANKLFSQECINFNDNMGILSAKEMEVLSFCLGSGAYGTVSNRIVSRVEMAKKGDADNGGKFKYVFRRFFPDMNYYKVKYPFCYKYKILIPFVAVYRIVTRSVVNFKGLAFEFKTIIKKK